MATGGLGSHGNRVPGLAAAVPGCDSGSATTRRLPTAGRRVPVPGPTARAVTNSPVPVSRPVVYFGFLLLLFWGWGGSGRVFFFFFFFNGTRPRALGQNSTHRGVN